MPKIRFNPTAEQRKQVAALAGVGSSNDDVIRTVAWGLPYGKAIDETTLVEHFAIELEQGRADPVAKLRKLVMDLVARLEREQARPAYLTPEEIIGITGRRRKSAQCAWLRANRLRFK